MTRTPLARIAGPIAIVAGLSVIVTRVVIMATTPRELDDLQVHVLSTTHAINGVASIVAFGLLIVALLAIYEWEATEAGSLGVVGVVAAVIGTVFMAGDWWYEAFAVPWLAEVAPVVFESGAGGRLFIGGVTSFILFAIGWAVFGAASVRARVFPVAISASILLGGILSGIPIAGAYLLGSVAFGASFCWLGIWMIRNAAGTEPATTQPVGWAPEPPR
jgi:hypothetical protein